MQISKLSSGKIKNFRIQLKTQLSSKQKQKNRSQSLQIKENFDKSNQKKDDFLLNNNNARKSKRSLSIISLLNHAKATNIHRDQTKIAQNIKKHPLVLSSKQKILAITNNKNDQKVKNQSQNTQKNCLITNNLKIKDRQYQKQNICQEKRSNENNFYMVQNQINSINNRKKNHKLSLSQKKIYEDQIKNQRQKIQQIQISKQIQNSGYLKQIQNSKINNSNYSWQDQFEQVFFNQFSITQQFSITLDIKQNQISNKISVGVQASSIIPTQDKYFIQYVRYRELKVKHYEQFQQKQAKINKMIQESLQFKNHYKLIIDSFKQIPFTDRQKRVFNLGKQLQDAQKKVKQAIINVEKVQIESQKYLERIIPQLQHKKDTLFVSITNLTRAFLTQKQKYMNTRQNKMGNQNIFQLKKQKTYCNILIRVINQFKYLKQLDNNQYLRISQIFGQYQKQVKQFKQSYLEWSGLFYQTRVLVYNCVKQIQKIPQITIDLFGLRSKQDAQKSFSPQIQFDEYMSAKCEQCYHTNKKVKFLQATNQQIKPILKSLEWLIRDMSKKRTCMSII